jgi:Mn2+/Fe2+ NRAMP family transporter
MAIVVVGTSLRGTFSFETLSSELALRLGAWAGDLFAVGLVAAGFTSAVTAPLAAAVTAGGLAGDSSGRSGVYHAVWTGVLLTGTAFGLAGFRPVPLILAVQAANGILLPFVAVFLWIVVNDRALLGERINGRAANVVFGTTVWITVSLGVLGVLRAATAAIGRPPPGRDAVLVATAAVTVALAWPVARTLARARASA